MASIQTDSYTYRSVNSTHLSSLGMLSALPRELRDEIYKITLDDNTGECILYDPSDPLKRLLNDYLEILHTSRAVRQEALATLHKYRAFRMEFADWSRYRGRSEVPFLDHISNVTLNCDLDTDDHVDEWPLLSDYAMIMHSTELKEGNVSLFPCAAPFSFFTGVQIPRKACTIVFINALRYNAPNLESPLFRAISNMTGFKTVTLSIKEWKAWNELSVADIEYAKAEALKFSSALEPFLGPGTVSKMFANIYFKYKITYQPQNFLAQKQVGQFG